MKVLLRKRYYCDHCKKSGGSSFHMNKHEKGCTLNPQRVCGVCNLCGFGSDDLVELIAFAKSAARVDPEIFGGDELLILDADGVAKLLEMTGGCPACALAALRQAKVSAFNHFDFKKLMGAVLVEHNAAQSEYL